MSTRRQNQCLEMDSNTRRRLQSVTDVQLRRDKTCAATFMQQNHASWRSHSARNLRANTSRICGLAIRDSLSYIRKAFEEELNRLWKKIASKNLQAQISVGMRGPGDPDLMSLATGLHKFLGGKDVAVFQEAVPHLGEILGYRDKHKVEWNCLNKGTHEGDRAEEFDAVIVRRMLETVIKLDEAIEAPQA